jgi:hypothetical protein
MSGCEVFVIRCYEDEAKGELVVHASFKVYQAIKAQLTKLGLKFESKDATYRVSLGKLTPKNREKVEALVASTLASLDIVVATSAAANAARRASEVFVKTPAAFNADAKALGGEWDYQRMAWAMPNLEAAEKLQSTIGAENVQIVPA